MKLQNIYSKDINRNINGVVNAEQSSAALLEQEFNEYIVTKELYKHFEQFYTRYAKSLDEPTSEIGVWISGFFGSGKSHFLKILSYLLENADIAGKRAIDYFQDKISDPALFEKIKKSCSVPTESVLFNIDVKGALEKDETAVLRVFAKCFYEHLGYYGTDLKVARFEQFLDRKGKLDAFIQRFEEISDDTWEEAREIFAFSGSTIAQAASDVLNSDADSVENWVEETNDIEYGIDTFVGDIKKYIDSKGKDFRLIFCVDELGQYMGDHTDYILNAQSIVEEIGAKCQGRVWVLVTSQEAIDEITKVRAQAFSKIQGRFKTRLSLTSSSVDEVIKKRILEKDESAVDSLRNKYRETNVILKNLITFFNAKKSYQGFTDEEEYVETYPFIPYQFNLFQDVLIKVREHSITGSHHSSGERSMLSGFQEVAQVLNDRDENALAPFYLFYNPLNSFLDSSIRRVIERCEQDCSKGFGIEPYDIDVLKLLYLLKYIDDIPTTVDNIATLMTDDINVDKIQLKEKVKASLERLLSQNYIGKSGNTYTFLTNEEQDVEREIKNVVLDSSKIVNSIHEKLFQDMYYKKSMQVGDNTIGFDKYVDDSNGGNNLTNNEILLRIITAASDYAEADDSALVMKSQNYEAICVLDNEYEYYAEIEASLKVTQYTKMKNISAMPDSVQVIIQKKRLEAKAGMDTAKELLAQAIINGSFYINGEKRDVPGGTVETKLNNALSMLIESVYSKMGYIHSHYKNAAEILEIFNNQQISVGVAAANPNADAIEEVALWIDTQVAKNHQIVMVDVLKRYKAIPYGWQEADVAAVVAQLIMAKRVSVVYGGAVYQKRDERLVDLLYKKSEVDKTKLEKREEIDIQILKRVKAFLMEYFNLMNIAEDEDSLAEMVVTKLGDVARDCTAKINRYYAIGRKYPGINTISKTISVIEDVLKKQKDHFALFNSLLDNDDELLDLKDDLDEVFSFLENQRTIFEEGESFLRKMKNEQAYLADIEDAATQLKELEAIITAEKPYRRINEIKPLIEAISVHYNGLLDAKRQELLDYAKEALADVLEAAEGDTSNALIKRAEQNLTVYWPGIIAKEESIVRLNSFKPQIAEKKDEFIKDIFAAIAQAAALEAARKQAEEQPTHDEPAQPVKPIQVETLARHQIAFSARLTTNAEIDQYVERIRAHLRKKLAENDEIQII